MIMDANAKPSYYLDASFVYTSTSGSNPNTPSGSFNLGAVPGDGPKYYNGKFSSAYFYDRVLSVVKSQRITMQLNRDLDYNSN